MFHSFHHDFYGNSPRGDLVQDFACQSSSFGSFLRQVLNHPMWMFKAYLWFIIICIYICMYTHIYIYIMIYYGIWTDINYDHLWASFRRAKWWSVDQLQGSKNWNLELFPLVIKNGYIYSWKCHVVRGSSFLGPYIAYVCICFIARLKLCFRLPGRTRGWYFWFRFDCT